MARKKRSGPSPTEPVSLVLNWRAARHGGSPFRLQGVRDGLPEKKRLSKDYRPGSVTVPAGTGARAPKAPTKPLRPVSYVAQDWTALEHQAEDALQHYRDTGDWRLITQLFDRLVGQRHRGQLAAWFGPYGTIRFDGQRLRFHPRRVAKSQADRSPARV